MKPVNVMLVTSFIGGMVTGVYNNIEGKKENGRHLDTVDSVIISNSAAIIAGVISKHLQ